MSAARQRGDSRWWRLVLSSVVVLGLAPTLSAQRMRLEQDRVRAGQATLIFASLDGSKLIEVLEGPSCKGLVIDRLPDMSEEQQSFDSIRGMTRSRVLYVRWRVLAEEPGKFEILGPRFKIDGVETRGSTERLEVLGDTPAALGFIELSLATPRIVREQRARLDVDVYFPAFRDPRDGKTSSVLRYKDRLREPPLLELPWISPEGALQLPTGLEGEDLQAWASRLPKHRENIALAIATRGLTLFSSRTWIPYAADDVVERKAPDGTAGSWFHMRYSFEVQGAAVGTYSLGPARLLGRTCELENGTLVQRELHARSEVVSLEVVEPPALGRPAHWSGAIGEFVFEVLPPAPTQLELGDEPVRMTLVVRGRGNLDGVSFGLESDPAFAASFHVEAPVMFEAPEPGTTPPPNHPRHEGETWRHFEYRLLPVREGALEIPAISFSWFDPVRGVYETKTSASYRIDVAPSSRSGPRSALAPPTNASRGKTPRSDRAPDVDDLNRLRDERPRWISRAFLVGAAALLWMVSVAFVARRRSRQLTPDQRRRRDAHARAKRRLEAAEALVGSGDRAAPLAAAAAAISGYFADRANAVEEGLVGQEVLELALKEGLSPSDLAPLEHLFQELDLARFGGIDAARVEAEISALSTWFDNLSARQAKSKGSQLAAFAPLMLGLAPWSAGTDALRSEEQGAQLDSAPLFQRALRATEEGRKADAERDYLELLRRGYEGGAVYFNLGNLYADSEDRAAEALACYRRAERYWPADANLRANLDTLLTKLPAEALRPPADGWLAGLFGWRREMAPRTLLDVTTLAWLCVLIAAMLRTFCGARFALGRITAFALFAAIIASVALALRASEIKADSHAVLRESAALRTGPLASFETIGAPLERSSELRVIERRVSAETDWVLLEAPNRSGWIEASALEIY